MKNQSKLLALTLVGLCQTSEAGLLEDLVNFTMVASRKIIAEPIVKNIEKQHNFKSGMVKYDADDDMPPEDHRDMWGRVESEHGACWYHVKTYKRICDKDQ